jgi:hypothetical protein
MILQPFMCYTACMVMPRRLSLICALIIAATVGAACADDTQPLERPENNSVGPWGSCMWEGSVTPDLCEASLSCTDSGVCVPLCDTVSDCEEFGFADVCGSQSGSKLHNVCIISCDPAGECPETGGATLECSPLFNWCRG